MSDFVNNNCLNKINILSRNEEIEKSININIMWVEGKNFDKLNQNWSRTKLEVNQKKT